MKLIKTKAFAKINLALEVLYKRKDDFHEINTIFCLIDLFDELYFETSEKISVVCDPDFGTQEKDNLVWKSAHLLKEFAKDDKLGVKIILKKNIPTGAGLGGGSSDAAATLVALSKVWNLDTSKQKLAEIGLMIGSDVPFFIYNGVQSATGRGEIFSKIDINLNYYALIIYPNIHISTNWAYHSLNRNYDKRDGSDFTGYLLKNINEPQKWKYYLKNDFEKPVFEKYPEISEIKEKLYEKNSFFSLLSGSGSTVFGLFNNLQEGQEAAKFLKNYKTYLCKVI